MKRRTLPETLLHFFSLLRQAFKLLQRHDPMILASATAFFTTFSLSPIIVILISVLSLYFKSENIRSRIFEKLEAALGSRTTNDIENIVNNFMAFRSSWWITVAGAVFLLFVATTLLGIIRRAIHQLWHIRLKTGKGLRHNLKERLVETALLLFLGVLVLLTLLLDTSLTVFKDQLHNIVPSIDSAVIRGVNIFLSILVVTTWFSVTFKVLPEARVPWKPAITGGFLTGILFTIGKYLLGRFLVRDNIATIFGASASIALLLLFIFYSSMIMYYGAAITHVFSQSMNKPIQPGKYAEEYEEKKT